jgi:hypothetical protein
MDYTNEPLEQMLASLPEDIKGVLFGFDTGAKIRDIGSKYSLHLDKSAILVDETNLVMFGITQPKDFLRIIESKLEVTHDIAEMIVHDINEQIFGSIRESLKKLHDTNNLIEITHDTTGENENKEQTALNSVDRTIFKESGVELATTETPAQMEEKESLIRDEVLSDIENPTPAMERKITPKNTIPQISPVPPIPALEPGRKTSEIKPEPDVIAQKLTDTFSIPKKETKYQLDPYREQI